MRTPRRISLAMNDRRVPFVLALILCGCAGYKPGSLQHKSRGQVRTVGCLDIAVEALSDPQAEGPAANIRFGNRCDAAVVVDLGAITATARYRDGSAAELIVYDPRNTLRPAKLDARAAGWEVFEYHRSSIFDNGGIVEELCLDLAAVDRQEPSADPVVACVPVGSSYWVGGGVPDPDSEADRTRADRDPRDPTPESNGRVVQEDRR